MFNKTLLKKIVTFSCVAALGVSFLAGCKKSDDKNDKENTNSNTNANTASGSSALPEGTAMKVAGHDVSYDEAMVYCLIEMLSGSVSYSYVKDDVDTYKAQIMNCIADTKVLNDIALENKMEFTEADEEERDKLIENFKSFTTQEVLDKYGISDEMIEYVMNEYSYAQKFEYVTKENECKSLYDSYTEEYKDYQFQSLYYMVFPIIETTSDGEMKKDDSGNYIPLSADEIQKAKDNLESAREKVKAGGNPEDIAKELGVDKFSNSSAGYVGGYADNVAASLENLKTGDCTELLEQDNCYYIVCMINDNDEDYKDRYIYKISKDEASTKYDGNKAKWMKERTANDSGVSDEFWTNLDILELTEYLYNLGLMG